MPAAEHAGAACEQVAPTWVRLVAAQPFEAAHMVALTEGPIALQLFAAEPCIGAAMCDRAGAQLPPAPRWARPQHRRRITIKLSADITRTRLAIEEPYSFRAT